MELEKQTQLNELYTRARNGELIQSFELSFIPSNLNRDFYYKDLLLICLDYRKAHSQDTQQIEDILNGEVDRQRKIKELELELLKLRGADDVNN